jgi:hypothetical protein
MSALRKLPDFGRVVGLGWMAPRLQPDVHRSPMMNRHPILSGTLLLAFASIGLAGCSSQGNGTNPGDSVLVDGAQHVVWKNLGGGFIGPIPATAPCHLESSFDFDVAGGSLSWSICNVATGGSYSDPSSFSVATGSRVLTAAERAQAMAAARAVKVTDNANSCGADKATLTLEVATQSGSTLYGDDFYACQKMYEHYVSSSALDQLGETLRGMAHD